MKDRSRLGRLDRTGAMRVMAHPSQSVERSRWPVKTTWRGKQPALTGGG